MGVNKLVNFVRRGFALTGAATLVSFGLPGVAAAGSIHNTGPHSNNQIGYSSWSSYKLTNNNNVWVKNSTCQTAHTGNANVSGNTNGGSAWTGHATNNNSTSAHVAISNSGGGGWGAGNSSWHATISNTGPNSNNQVSFNSGSKVKVVNNNNVAVKNYTSQTAHTGNSNVSGNTNGGSTSTGHATNNNSTNTAVMVHNDTGSSWGGSSTSTANATIHNTGPYSNNQIGYNSWSSYSSTNNNNVNVSNSTNQYASSGDANVSGNTNGGSATTGNSTNNNSTNTEVEIHNN
jgi:hypothetical protein